MHRHGRSGSTALLPTWRQCRLRRERRCIGQQPGRRTTTRRYDHLSCPRPACTSWRATSDGLEQHFQPRLLLPLRRHTVRDRCSLWNGICQHCWADLFQRYHTRALKRHLDAMPFLHVWSRHEYSRHGRTGPSGLRQHSFRRQCRPGRLPSGRSPCSDGHNRA